MRLTDVRRLTGVNFHSDRTGAVAEAVLPDDRKDAVTALWRKHMRALLDQVGWQDETITTRAYPGGISLMISAPMDALNVATDMIESVWQRTVTEMNGNLADDHGQAAAFKAEIADEQNPALVALETAAHQHGVTFLDHDGGASVGLGTGCSHWDDSDLPDPAAIDWQSVHDIPVAMVTGTNGKSTTVRLTAAIGAAAGKIVGQSSSDWVRVGDDIVDKGDYSGPAGARLAVRDRRVELAVIETARGGLMRRGLPIPQADACLLTNIAADHLGDYGITDVEMLADAKFLLTRAVRPGGRLVLNADDPALVARAHGFDGQISWFTLSSDPKVWARLTQANARLAYLRDGVMMLVKGGQEHAILAVDGFAPALKGAAKYNVANALGAILLADALNLPVSAMTAGLAGFQGTPDENPGRGNFMEIGGVQILVDFAHNPHGVAALASAVADVPAKRRLFLLGQAGDRSDEDSCELARAIWAARPDRVIVKELETKLRGRPKGELPAVLKAELIRLGAREDAIGIAESEYDSVIQALNWARAGDFLVLLLHGDRAAPMRLLAKMTATGWQAGDPLPT